MKIVSARVSVCWAGRNYVTLLVDTDEGVQGLGDATLNGRELAVVAYLQEHVCPLLIGRDPQRIEDTWQYLYRGAYWRRGPVTMTAIGAVDVALWDIKSKLAGVPLYQLLGGAVRDSVRVYAHAEGRDRSELLEQVGKLTAAGFDAVRVQAAVPGLDATYGVRGDERAESYEPAASDYPVTQIWDTDRYLRAIPGVFEAVRDAYGGDLAILHDVHNRLTPLEAVQLGRSLEPFRPFWIEDPTLAEDQRSFRQLREGTTVPLAVGETFNSVWDCHDLVQGRLVDYLRLSPSHAGGVTHLRKIHLLAELHGVRTGPHAASDLSPVALAAILHLDLAAPNFGIQEYMERPRGWDDVFSVGYRLEAGRMHPGQEPGLGVTYDERAAERLSYRRRYLPVARLRDGSMSDW